MNVRELIQTCDPDAFVAFYNTNYGPAITRRMFAEQILKFCNTPDEETELVLVMSNDRNWIAVLGRGLYKADDVAKGQEHLIGTQTDFSLSMQSWGEMLAMQVDPTVLIYPQHEIAAHVFEEMIYFGWDAADKNAIKAQLINRIKEIDEK